ncbi:FixH family protein [Segetibacter koreensis]|uniref:FixH family protein n=1 Tax=Segetibacter koreensis TaxID=398037 RepID=UPI00036E58EA|nr:FixH family protein [Segetibacter koreensis]
MTWGNKLILVFIGFAVLMSTLVYKCMKQNFELVSKDYYNDELRYQDKIDGVNNANKLSNVQITQIGDEVSIQLPKELNGLATTGKAWFYCATNASNDRKIPVEVNDEGVMVIDKTKLAKANYQVKLSWQTGSDKFYNEQKLEVK